MLVQVTVSVFAVAECWGGGGCSVLCVSLGQPTQLITHWSDLVIILLI